MWGVSRRYAFLKQQGLKEERVMLLEAWREAEARAGASRDDIESVEAKFPRKIKMRRAVVAEDGRETGFEEYYDYQFPDDEKKIVGLKLLENAMKWKMAAASAAAATTAAAVAAPSERMSSSESEGESDGERRGAMDSNEMNIDDDEE